MRRRIAKFCILGLVVPLLITGCSDNGKNQAELSPIPEVRESFVEESNKLKSQTFDNLNFENTYFSFPDVNEVYSFEYKITDFDISADDAYDYMCRRIDELFPGMFSNEEKAREIKFYDVGTTEYPTLEQYKALEEKNYPYILSNHPTTGIKRGNKCLLRVLNGVLWSYDDGTLARLNGFTGNLGSFDALSKFPVIYRTENIESEKVFHLLDGDISIADAVNSAEKLLLELNLSERELPFKMRIRNVNVLDIGNDCCAFYFGIVPEYKGIKSDCILPDDSVLGFSSISDSTNERDSCGELIMCESDRICRYGYLNPASVYDVTKSSSIASIIPLKNAAQTVSEYLSEDMHFNVLSISAGNKSFSDFSSYPTDSESYESYERRTITVRPCWRFVLQPLTGNTDRLYYIFIDMVTGKAYSTVQQTQSDVKYD